MTNVTSLYGLKIVAYGGQAAISFINGETGEVAKVKLADGYHDLTNYQPLLGAFDCVIENAIVNNTASGIHRIVDQRSDDFGNTAAVSTYTPSEAVRFQRAVEDIAHRVAQDMAARPLSASVMPMLLSGMNLLCNPLRPMTRSRVIRSARPVPNPSLLRLLNDVGAFHETVSVRHACGGAFESSY